MELKDLVLEAFQATSIILVFVTMFFSMKHPIIIQDIGEEIPEGDIAKEDLKKG